MLHLGFSVEENHVTNTSESKVKVGGETAWLPEGNTTTATTTTTVLQSVISIRLVENQAPRERMIAMVGSYKLY